MTTTAPKSALELHGVPVSPGIAIARVFCLADVPTPTRTTRTPREETQRLEEFARFDDARRQAQVELAGLRDKVAAQVGDEQATIFDVHRSILEDSALVDRIRRCIVEQDLDAALAIEQALEGYAQIFSRIQDEYLQERLIDVRDVLRRVGRILARRQLVANALDGEPFVLAAQELLPSDVPLFIDQNVVGVATERGSRTSHAAILARSYGLPAVSGISGLLAAIATGDEVIVDGRGGLVLAHPSSQDLATYRELQSQYARLERSVSENAGVEARTEDGRRLWLWANIACPADAEAAADCGATGIGLYRTEYFFLSHPSVPTEVEQVEAYRSVIDAAPSGPVTIRALDLGGDKTIPYLEGTREANPFMGWRSIRLLFEHESFFLTQLRAVLRCAEGQPDRVRLLFPMITTRDEMERVLQLVARAREQLIANGHPWGQPQIGMMIEVPAAALTIDDFFDLVDFAAIGSNDLVQYVTAADRDNPKVAHLCDAFNPAVLQLLTSVIQKCNDARLPVSVCGEMAGSPGGFLLLLGMGLANFSMSPQMIPLIKDLASRVSTSEATKLLADTRGLRTSREISQLVREALQRLHPEALLMTSQPGPPTVALSH